MVGSGAGKLDSMLKKKTVEFIGSHKLRTRINMKCVNGRKSESQRRSITLDEGTETGNHCFSSGRFGTNQGNIARKGANKDDKEIMMGRRSESDGGDIGDKITK